MADTTSKPENSEENCVVVATGITGTVKWFSTRSGYGFISRSDTNEDVFVHRTAIEAPNPEHERKSLADKEECVFDVIKTSKGFEACKVTGPGGAAVKGTRRVWRSRYRGRGGRRGGAVQRGTGRQRNYSSNQYMTNGYPPNNRGRGFSRGARVFQPRYPPMFAQAPRPYAYPYMNGFGYGGGYMPLPPPQQMFRGRGRGGPREFVSFYNYRPRQMPMPPPMYFSQGRGGGPVGMRGGRGGGPGRGFIRGGGNRSRNESVRSGNGQNMRGRGRRKRGARTPKLVGSETENGPNPANVAGVLVQ